MVEDADAVIRKSLDAVDRHRRRMFAGFIVVVIVMIIAQFRFGLAAADEVPRRLTAILVVLMLWTSAMAVAVIVQLARMTKMILRAIELASKPQT